MILIKVHTIIPIKQHLSLLIIEYPLTHLDKVVIKELQENN